MKSDTFYWSMLMLDGLLTVRIGDAMVHRVMQILSGGEAEDQVVLECGVRAPRKTAETTSDDVDCMGCAIRKTSRAMEGVWIENGALDLFSEDPP